MRWSGVVRCLESLSILRRGRLLLLLLLHRLLGGIGVSVLRSKSWAEVLGCEGTWWDQICDIP